MPTWIQLNATLLWWLTGFSLAAFFGTLIAVPLIVARIPTDYFVSESRIPIRSRHPVIRLALIVVKNIVGLILVLVGIPMLVLPGQGILTILIGLLLVNFPGKYQFERWLIGRPMVLRSVNWLRKRAGRPNLAVPARDAARKGR